MKTFSYNIVITAGIDFVQAKIISCSYTYSVRQFFCTSRVFPRRLGDFLNLILLVDIIPVRLVKCIFNVLKFYNMFLISKKLIENLGAY